MKLFKSTRLDVVKKVFDITLAGFNAAYPEEAAAIRGIDTHSATRLTSTEAAAMLKLRQYVLEQMSDTYEASTLLYDVPKYGSRIAHVVQYLNNPTKIHRQRLGAFWFATNPLCTTEAGIYALNSKKLVTFKLEKAEHNSYNLSIDYADDCPTKLRIICSNLFQAYKEGCLDSFKYSFNSFFFNSFFEYAMSDKQWQKYYSEETNLNLRCSIAGYVLGKIVHRLRDMFC